jgi:hypothetical protein
MLYAYCTVVPSNTKIKKRKILNLRTLFSKEFLNSITIFRQRLHTKGTPTGVLNFSI